MNDEAQHRRELGMFLRARREQLTRTDLDLPTVGGRSTGLRREEVAYLSGVSITWYTWLEQGREITPSRQVLDAVARTLHLSAAEHAYVLSLAGYSAAPHPAAEPNLPATPAHVQRLLDALGDLPAYVIGPDWTILSWTPPYAALYPNVATTPDGDRNLLWLAFTDPYLRDLQPDWEAHSARQVAKFRAEVGTRLGEPPFARLVERLLEASHHFRTVWERHDIGGFAPSERLYHHPIAGDLCLEAHRMALSDQPDVHLVIYTPMPDTDTRARLRRLVGDQAPPNAGSALGS
jgi:transcriptional regulator with XRE-family HTH domain